MSGRQLHLFKSRRQRGVAAPPPLEFATQCALADTLRKWATPNWVWNHIPGGEERPAEFIKGKRVSFAGERTKRAGFQPGWPDLILIPPAGPKFWQRPHFLELKRRGGKLTEHQASFALWCKLNGCPHAVADSYEAAVKILQRWGALMDRVKVQ
jgi:hypothetical protein